MLMRGEEVYCSGNTRTGKFGMEGVDSFRYNEEIVILPARWACMIRH